jgi:DNA mismatch repair protein MutS
MRFLKKIAAHLDEMESFWKFFFRFDAYVSIATTMEAKGFCMPAFHDWGIALENVFHPLLQKPVKNSITTNAGIILLTGANMSGKSTFLKALSMCVYLAHLGIGVPASTCVMPYFNDIVVNINSKDDLQSGLSHFMSEVAALKSAVLSAAKGQNVFAVMDELFAGTNTEDAEALLQLTIEGLQKYNKGLFIISTHYSQLKEFVSKLPHHSASYYLDARLEKEFPVFTYNLKEGWSNHKFGMLLFEREGLKRLFEV